MCSHRPWKGPLRPFNGVGEVKIFSNYSKMLFVFLPGWHLNQWYKIVMGKNGGIVALIKMMVLKGSRICYYGIKLFWAEGIGVPEVPYLLKSRGSQRNSTVINPPALGASTIPGNEKSPNHPLPLQKKQFLLRGHSSFQKIICFPFSTLSPQTLIFNLYFLLGYSRLTMFW